MADQPFPPVERAERAPNEQSVPRMRDRVWEVIKVFVLPILLVLVIRFYVVQPFIVRGASMEPNFEDSQYLIVDELSPRVLPFARGDVIVFRYPDDPSEFFIKRVIGLPGEHMTIQNGSITIRTTDGKTVIPSEPYLARGAVTLGSVDMDIPAGNYFVLGDNRNFSSDSRLWGLLPKNLVTGRVLLRLWPPDKVSIIHRVSE